VPLLRSVGYGGALIPLGSITLLPALLTKAGPVLERPTSPTGRHRVHTWTAWGRLAIRRRWTAVLIAALVLIALLVRAFSLWWLGRRAV
jgi:RND superfamily putative drug exporter